jgi:hypothetical protein
MTWSFSQSINPDGYGIFCTHVWDGTHAWEDVTFFRDVPVLIQSMEFVDPFGDAVAVLEFPQCSGYDSGTGDTWFLNENVNVDIWWVPCTTSDMGDHLRVLNPSTNELGTMWLDPGNAVIVYEGYTVNVDPQPTMVTLNCQGCLWQVDRFFAKPVFPLRPKTVESMIERYFEPNRRGLFTQPMQIDWEGSFSGIDQLPEYFNYYPLYFTDDKLAELVAKDDVLMRFVPTALAAGDYWTGYLTRYTGGWDKALTSYIASQLSYMYYQVPEGNDPAVSGLTEGDSWTIGKKSGRIPVMYLKRQARTPDLVAYYGQPGVELQLTRDGTQSTNVIFGRGKGNDGSQWMVQNFPQKAPWSAWRPIGWDRSVGSQDVNPADNKKVGIYHWGDPDWVVDPADPTGTPLWEKLPDGYDWHELKTNNIWVQEKNWASIPNGIEQDDAETIAEMYIARDKDPGWIGTATLQVDLRDSNGDPVSKWTIRTGMVIVIKGFRGYNDIEPGVNVFHIARVEMRPQDGSVTLTLDTKFREIVSIEEAQQSTRDSLAPMKMLQVGRESALIEDLAMAWNINQGAGCFPTDSIHMEKRTSFPYSTVNHLDTRKSGQMPKDIFKKKFITGSIQLNKEIIRSRDTRLADKSGTLANAVLTAKQDSMFYIPINVSNPNKSLRWGFYPLLLSQAFTISRTEFACYDLDGNLAPVEFHVSIFRTYNWDVTNMPNEAAEFASAECTNINSIKGSYGVLWDGAFEKIDPATGQMWDWGPTLRYQYHMPSENSQWFQGWGTFERPAGYSPGAKDRGDQPTGMLMDGAPWGFDFNQSADFISGQVQKEDQKGYTPMGSSYSGGIAVYAQLPTGSTFNHPWVYAMGRMFRQPQTGA